LISRRKGKEHADTQVKAVQQDVEKDGSSDKAKPYVPEDKRIVSTVIRQLKDLDRILSDAQVKGILEDKDRLGAALTNKDVGELRDNCKNFIEKLPDSQKTVEDLAKTLVEVQMDKLTD
jgi:hypothetical protein